MTAVDHNRPFLGILCMSVGMLAISINDMLVKDLSDRYPLHQLVLLRAIVGISVTAIILQFEGGWRALRVLSWRLHALRAAFIVFANSCLYAAIAAMPLATATAIYFVAPLFVTLLAIPVLGEQVGWRRILAISVGFLGVLVILGPELGSAQGLGWVVVLPVLGAAGYASMSVLTRKLGATAPASVLAFWIQAAFLLSGLIAFVTVGDGRYAQTPGISASANFLLRPWIWPPVEDLPVLFGLGVLTGIVGYVMSQAYRLASASTVAPFEYLLLLYALFWGWVIFDEWPRNTVFIGAAIIVGSGIFIVLRERQRQLRIARQASAR